MEEHETQHEEANETPMSVSSRNPLQVVWRHRFLILLGGIVGLILGALFYAQRPPVYQSSAQILVVKKRADLLPSSGPDPRMSFYEDYVSTHLIVIRSPVVIQRAVRKRELSTLRSFEGGDPTGAIIGGLSAARDVNKDANSAPNNIINLTYRGGDSSDTGTVLAAVIESYQYYLDEVYQNVSDDALKQIVTARDSLRKDLATKEKSYREFRTKAPHLGRKGGDGNVHLTRLREFQTKQTGLLARAGEIRERLKRVEQARKEGKSTAVLEALAARPLEKDATAKQVALERQLEEQLFPLMLREKALMQDYGADHPDVIRVREQIRMTRDFFARLDKVTKKGEPRTDDAQRRIDMLIEALDQEGAVVDAASASLRSLITDAENEARALERYEIEDEAHRADIALTAKILEETLKSHEQMNLTRNRGGFEARVLAEPGPGGKISPIAWQLIIGGVFMGLMVGLGAAYLLEVTDTSFRSPEEIRQRLRLPIVGHIPFMPQRSEPVVVTTESGQVAELDGALIEYHKPLSVEAEAYRSVRTALYFRTNGERHKVIQVTSPSMGDGKSTLIANLAVSIAQSGRKVILVDADLRRPRVHRVFGVPSTRLGLAQVIAGDAELNDTIQPTIISGLSVLPCGARPNDPGELLTQPRFADVLEELRDQFDYVLVDTPPLLAVSDPCAVAPRVDGVLLTIRVSKNGRPAAERARDLLLGLRVNILGVVINGVGKEGAMAGYGYEHYNYVADYVQGYTHVEPEAEADTDTDVPNHTVNHSQAELNGSAS